MKKKLMPILCAVAAALICCGIYGCAVTHSRSHLEKKELKVAADRLSDEMNNAFAYADMMELAIQFRGSQVSEEEFLKLSNTALEQSRCISSFQLAPDAVVSYINPLEGNEEAIGHDLLSDKDRLEFVQEAIDSHKVIPQGPLDSIQGTSLIFGRKAIRVDGKFWGLAIIAVDFEDLLEECGITKNQLSFDCAIATYDTDGKCTYKWGDTDLIKSSKTYTDARLAGQRWRIYAGQSRSLGELVEEYGMCGVTGILVGILVYIFLSQLMLPGRCRRHVGFHRHSHSDNFTQS